METRAVCLDPRLQWSRALNIWRNAAMWSGLYWIFSPRQVGVGRGAIKTLLSQMSSWLVRSDA